MPTVNSKTCSYAGCKKRIPENHYLCPEHYEDSVNELINQRPKCGRFKISDYKLCSDCRFGRLVKQHIATITIPKKKDTLPVEHSKAWEKADKEFTKFFIYILKLANGKFHVGHSNDMRTRLSEHQDGETISTKGLNPKLKYFEYCLVVTQQPDERQD